MKLNEKKNDLEKLNESKNWRKKANYKNENLI